MHPDLATLEEKIVAMDVWHVALPVNSRRDHGIGTVADAIEIVVVRLTGESGQTGFGEASPWSVFTGTPEASFAALDRYLRPHVVGRKLGDFEATMALARKAVVHCTEAKAALEAAWLDLAGKILAKPVWALLGAQCRSTIPLSVSLANLDFDQDKELVQRLIDDQVGFVKLKTGFKDHAFDMMRLEYLQTQCPSLTVRVDYNQGLTVEQALKDVPEIDQLAPSFIEQPVAHYEYEAMAQLRSLTQAPLLADESVFGPQDMRRAIREQICDGVSVKIMKSAGMVQGMEVARLAAEAGLPAYGGDMFESGLAHLAGVHMIACAPNISLGCEFYQATYYLNQDLMDAPFPIEAGQVVVPDCPGLGMNVDMQVLEQHAVVASKKG
ncbi:MAG: muconate cycloisomerase [Rhizobiaceae bacterium]|nr:cycloisomerase [Hyphomicrobiales bacterium]NRB29058.1 muconate cycloisomerase [Rhizobiaceae bacterium]